LSGSHFRHYHLLFQEQAESIFESIDPLAERMRRIGGTTIRSICQISQLQMIEDDNDEFVPPEQMIQRWWPEKILNCCVHNYDHLAVLH